MSDQSYHQSDTNSNLFQTDNSANSISKKIRETPEHRKIFENHTPAIVQGALDLYRKNGGTLDLFQSLSQSQKCSISKIIHDHHEELACLLEIWAYSTAVLTQLKEHGDVNIQKVSEELGALTDKMHNGEFSPSSKHFEDEISSRAQNIPNQASGSHKERAKFFCTYFCGKDEFQRDGHRHNHELTHHNGRRSITCLHRGCNFASTTILAYKVHHNKKHKNCQAPADCFRSDNILPPKTASSCGYCGKLFEGESNFEDRCNHIAKAHHNTKNPELRKCISDWSRDILLEGKDGTQGLMSRKELKDWVLFKENQARMDDMSPALSWQKVPEKKWKKLLEQLEYGVDIGNSQYLGFTDDAVQNIFRKVLKLGRPTPSHPSSSSTSLGLTTALLEAAATPSNQETHDDQSMRVQASDPGTKGDVGHGISESDHLWGPSFAVRTREEQCWECDTYGADKYDCKTCLTYACDNCCNDRPACPGEEFWKIEQ